MPYDLIAIHSEALRVASHYSPNHADDIAQDVVVKFLETPPNIQESLTGYIRTAVYTCKIDAVRKASKFQSLPSEFQAPADNETPAAIAERKDTVLAVRSALFELSNAEAELATDYYAHEKRISDIAETLNCPRSTTRDRIISVGRKLQRKLACLE